MGASRPETKEPALAELLTALRTELLAALAATERRLLGRARDAGMTVPLARQLLSQAPPSAVGYRLVLPADSVGGKPRYAPRKTTAGTAPCWTVRPLQLPDDDRLREGEVYRIVWLDAQGRRIAPMPTAGVPGLQFFLSKATLSDDPVDQQYEQALNAATGQPSESRVREHIAERSLRRARDLEEQTALRRRADREAEELRRAAAHLAEKRKQTEARAELQQQAQKLADAQVAAQHPTWQLWLPIGISFLPALVQVGLLIWDRFLSDPAAKGENADGSQNKLREVFRDALVQMSGVLNKLSPPSAKQIEPPQKSGSSPPAEAAQKPTMPGPAPEGNPPGPGVSTTQPPSGTAALELEKTKARIAEIQREAGSLAQAPDTLEKVNRLRSLNAEVTQLVAQAHELTRALGTLPPVPLSPPRIEQTAPSAQRNSKTWEQLQAKVARFEELDRQHRALESQPRSLERDQRMAAGVAEAQGILAEMTAAGDELRKEMAIR